MPRFINDFHGIVWSIHEEYMEVQLPRGGIIRAPITEGIHIGQHVVFIMNATDQHVVDVIPKRDADEQVKRGSNHIYDAALRHAPLEKEDEYAEQYAEYGDVFWCPELI